MTTVIAQRRADLTLPGEVTDTGYVLPEDLAFEEWQQIGGTLRRLGKSVMWWIGDWLRYGERKYGETYAQAVDATGYDYQTLQDAVWVAGKVEISGRRENLSWSHHRAAAALEAPERDAVLEEAELEGWSVMDLRREVKQHRQPTPAPAPSTPGTDVSHADHRQSCYAEVKIGYAAPLPKGMPRPEVYDGPESHTRERSNIRVEWFSERFYLGQRAPVSAVEAKRLADEIAESLLAKMLEHPLISMLR